MAKLKIVNTSMRNDKICHIAEFEINDIEAKSLCYSDNKEYAIWECETIQKLIKIMSKPRVKKVITDNPPYTTILFEDGTKRIVKAQIDGEEDTFIRYKEKIKEGLKKYNYIKDSDGKIIYDRDKGIMIAILERIYGKKEFYKIMSWGKNDKSKRFYK